MTDSRTWSSYEEAATSTVGDGLGYVLGEGIGCVDLDGCFGEGDQLHPVARRILDEHPHALRVERSVSGKGLHIWDRMPEAMGSNRMVDGQQVEIYSRARFIALGTTYRPGGLHPLRVPELVAA
ncbi:hypothetical protein ACLMLA_01800 [Brachybacterium epidermidis]